MAVFRSRPFVSAAIFWAYRGSMGVVDNDGCPRPSWQTLREDFAPVKIEQARFSFPAPGQCRVDVTLRTRGPIEVDLPAYTLRSYRIAWEFLSRSGQTSDIRGEKDLPELSPGTIYNLSIELPCPTKRSELHISVIRPNGFCVIDRQFISP
jgi:hypothetical protein